MTRVELIQASINKANGSIVYTFRLTYVKKSWLNIFPWHKPEYITKYITNSTDKLSVKYNTVLHGEITLYDCDSMSFALLQAKVLEITDFVRKVLDQAVTPKPMLYKQRVDQQEKAKQLFGERYQDVLKIYGPGEWHRPLGEPDDRILYAEYVDHNRLATSYGWSQ